MTPQHKPFRPKGDLIGGRFRAGGGKRLRLVSEDPGDLDHPVGEMTFSPSAVAPAVEAARKAFGPWASADLETRSRAVERFGAALSRNSEALALAASLETGKTIEESRTEVARVVAKAASAREHETRLLRPEQHESGPGLTGTIRFRPRGVIAVLSPFNVPVHLAASQTISALLTGNTVVLKPSELAPFTAQALAELWTESELPPGVFNLVQGDGSVGKALVSHPGVDGVFFTGSWETGSRIRASLLNEPQKLCALEMGGKNAAIVLADCDLDNAVEEAFTGAYLTTGQRCNATSRILVEKPVAKEFTARFLKKVDAMRVGYATEPGVFMGPVASKKGFERVLAFLKKARREGFEVLRAGGPYTASGRGYYLKPSVHFAKSAPRGATREGSYTDEEVFGPDVAITAVKDLNEAIRVNNRPHYGLAVSVFTRSREAFERVHALAEDGVINWNIGTVRSSGRLPFGGLKRSGNHRPAGFFSPYLCTVPTASVEKRPAP